MQKDKFTELLKYLKCRSFFPDYCDIKYTSTILTKLGGKNRNGNPATFSPEQKQKIIQGLETLLESLKDS